MTRAWESYLGSGEPGGSAPLYEGIIDEDPEKYLATPELKSAVHVAITLGMPLLLTGPPGSGKSRLAGYLAHRLGKQKPLVFQAKTTSAAQDLFYRYDALRHLHAVHAHGAMKGSPDDVPRADRFIEFQALGEAIIRASSHALQVRLLGEEKAGPPRRSVLLIDEIDKAPRDFPNDVLDEIESMSFTVRETGDRIPGADAVAPHHRPIVVITSNSEKNLPEPFLRRCAFFYIEPPNAAQLKDIVDARLGRDEAFFTPADVKLAIDLFVKVRDQGRLTKPPSTAEFLVWLSMLKKSQTPLANLSAPDSDALLITCSILAKSKADRERLKSAIRA